MYHLLESDYQRSVPSRKRCVGVTEAWEVMDPESLYLFSVASLIMSPPHLIFFYMAGM
jgi:hypothetical protein